MEFIDLKTQYEKLKPEIDAGIQKVLDHGQYIMGPEVREFEQQMSEYLGVKHAIACANGTDALQLLFMAYGIGEGDAVFTSDITFISSVEPACMLGATPVFCDIDERTYNISPESLEKQIKAVIADGKLTPKIVVAVDILGNPADFDGIEKVCKKYDLILMEDAAQSFGAEYKGKKCCSFGHSAMTSFFPAKPLGCYGDGGAIFTEDDELAEVLKSLIVHGKGPAGKYNNIRIGVNSRLDTIQAAILIAKLKAFKDYEMDKRQEVANYYSEAFKEHFVTPYIPSDALSAWAQYALLADTTEQRDRIISHLTKKGIPNMVYYPTPQHQLPVFSDYNHYDETYPNAVHYCATTFSLPMHPYLTKEEQDIVIEAVLEAK